MVNRTHEFHEHAQSSVQMALGGAIAEGFAGAGAAVLAVLGLAGVSPFAMLYLGTIIVGVALFFGGVAVSSRFARLIAETEEEAQFERLELTSGATAETVAGVVGIVLGILALFGVAPLTLTSIAMIIFGGALIIGCRINFRLNAYEVPGSFHRSRELAREVNAAAGDVQMLVGIASVILGAFGLFGTAPLILSLVALLCLGTANFLSGSAIGGRLLQMFQR